MPIEQLKRRIKMACLQRRVRLQEFMKTFDRTKTKKVTKPHFSRALDVAGVRLSADELQMLYDEYGSANGLDVDYQIFCDEMDDVFTTKNLESMPTMQVSGSLQGQQLAELGDPEMTQVEKMELEDLVAQLAHTVKCQGIIVKGFFKDFDKNNVL